MTKGDNSVFTFCHVVGESKALAVGQKYFSTADQSQASLVEAFLLPVIEIEDKYM